MKSNNFTLGILIVYPLKRCKGYVLVRVVGAVQSYVKLFPLPLHTSWLPILFPFGYNQLIRGSLRPFLLSTFPLINFFKKASPRTSMRRPIVLFSKCVCFLYLSFISSLVNLSILLIICIHSYPLNKMHNYFLGLLSFIALSD